MKSKELREKAGELANKIEVLALECRQAGRAPTEDEQKQVVELRTEAKRLLTEAEGYDLLDSYEGEKLTRLRRNDVSFSSVVNTAERANLDLAVRSFLGQRDDIVSRPEWDAHAAQLRMTGRSYNAVKTRAWSSTTSGSGSEFVPTTLGDSVYKKMLAFGGVLNYLASNGGVFETSTGEPFNFPIFDATGLTGAILAEKGADSGETTLASSSKAYSAYGMTSGIQLISHQSIRDSKFPIVDILSEGLGMSIGRAIASYLVNGTGSAQPQGFVPSATVGVTTASPTAFSYNELAALFYSVDKAYADNGVWVVSRDAMRAMSELTDTIGRPLFLDNIRVGLPATLFGCAIYVDVNMDTVAATHKPVAFGNIAAGYKARMIGDLEIRTTTDRYWEYNQTAVVANQFMDARVVNTAAYAVMQMHA